MWAAAVPGCGSRIGFLWRIWSGLSKAKFHQLWSAHAILFDREADREWVVLNNRHAWLQTSERTQRVGGLCNREFFQTVIVFSVAGLENVLSLVRCHITDTTEQSHRPQEEEKHSPKPALLTLFATVPCFLEEINSTKIRTFMTP